MCVRRAPLAGRWLIIAHPGERADLRFVLQLLFVSAVVMGVSHTVAKERIFAPIRDRLGGKETWAGYLVSCPYCLSHWLAFGLVPLAGIYPIRVVVHWGIASRIVEWFLAAILVTVIAAFLRVAFWFIDETQALVRKQKANVEEETQTERQVRERLGEADAQRTH
jgi:hypothetical protein